MYNKLFAKIVTSSIWLEPTPTRIVWLMFIAMMNEDGFVQFASVANVAHTARITEPEAEEAIKILESPDPNSADEEHEGRRIERVPGGWLILNAIKYRDLVTREMVKAQTRERVARFRAKLKNVTICNADVTQRNDKVTQSDTDTEVQSKSKRRRTPIVPLKGDVLDFFKELGSETEDNANDFYDHFASNGWRVGGRAPMVDWKAAARKWYRNAQTFQNKTTKPSRPSRQSEAEKWYEKTYGRTD